MSDVLPFIFFIVISFLCFLPILFLALREKRKQDVNKAKFLDYFKAKFALGFDLTSKDVVTIGRAHDLSAALSRNTLYKVIRDLETREDFDKFRVLVAEIEKEEPFDTMPDEVKSTLLRISVLTHEFGGESDKHILTPITNILTKYQELLEEQRKIKKRSYIAYILAIISFIIGVTGLYFTVKAPTANDIATELSSSKNSL